MGVAIQNEVNVAVKVDTSYYEQAAEKATNIGKRFALGLGLAADGVRILNDFMLESVNLAQIQEDAEKKLETALGRRSQALLNQASALQEVTTYGDEAIIGAQALIAAFVKDEEHIKAATKATLDFAVATGMDLREATDLVAKTIGTSTNALSDYGITVKGAVGSTERLDSMTRAVTEKFGGQASAAAETYSGKIQQLSNKYANMKEKIGSAVLESGAFDVVLEALNPAVDDLTTYIVDHKDDIGDFAKGLGSIAASAVEAGVSIGKMTSKLMEWSPLFVATLSLTFEKNPFLAIQRYNDEIKRLERNARKAADGVESIFAYDPETGRFKTDWSSDDFTSLEKNETGKGNGKGNGNGNGDCNCSGGGSGTGDDDTYQENLQSRIDALRKSLMDEKELLDSWYEEQLDLVKERYGEETGVHTEGGELRIELAREYKERLDEINGVPAMKKELEALQDHFKSKEELERERYEKQLEDLEKWQKEEIDKTVDYNELKEQIEKEHKDNLVAIKKEEADKQKAIEEEKRKAIMKGASSFLSAFAKLNLGESKKMFNIQKAAALAAAYISAAESIVHSYKEGSRHGGPALGAVYAAAAGMAQMSNIQAIASQSYNGGSKGGAPSGAGSTGTSSVSDVSQTPVQTNAITVYGIDKNSLYSGDQIEAIAEGLNEYMADGGKIYIK